MRTCRWLPAFFFPCTSPSSPRSTRALARRTGSGCPRCSTRICRPITLPLVDMALGRQLSYHRSPGRSNLRSPASDLLVPPSNSSIRLIDTLAPIPRQVPYRGRLDRHRCPTADRDEPAVSHGQHFPDVTTKKPPHHRRHDNPSRRTGLPERPDKVENPRRGQDPPAHDH